MFHNIPQAVQDRMSYLEAMDSQDRQDGTLRMERLRQIPPVTGKFLALLAAGSPEGEIIEIGTSAGYSTLWLALACRTGGRPLTTFELLPEKVQLAQDTFRLSGMTDLIKLVPGDARDYVAGLSPVAFCFLDAEKEIYGDCYELVVPKLVPGGLLVADNAINHHEILQPMLDRALNDGRVDAVVLPVGNGQLVCRKI